MKRTTGCVVAAALLCCMALVAGANAADAADAAAKGAPLSSSVGGVGVTMLNIGALLPSDNTSGPSQKRRSLLSSPVASFEVAMAAAASEGASSARKMLEAKALDQRRLVWDADSCWISSARRISCKSGYAMACCNDDYCSSNPDGNGGWCPSDTDLGCC